MEILHVAHRSDWERARRDGRYTVSTRGRDLDEVGFIHGSTAAQVSGVAERFYRDDPETLVVLVIGVDLVRADGTEVRFEDGGDGQEYPHIYGPVLPSHVIRVEPAGFIDGVFRWGVDPSLPGVR
ncbi:DUF952 domain-containing protein [Microbacterium sp. NPDC058389]|uniref:DUF952 domain-containing protein n=1 Tax=Microbacterium sp. NPDC058389 TaxID=3346475 RepID=UPI0036472F8E